MPPVPLRISLVLVLLAGSAACVHGDRPRVDLTVSTLGPRAIDEVRVTCPECPYQGRFSPNGKIELMALADVPARIEVDYVEQGAPHHHVLAIAPRGSPAIPRRLSIVFPRGGGSPTAQVTEMPPKGAELVITDSGTPRSKLHVALRGAIERGDSAEVDRLLSDAQLPAEEVAGYLGWATSPRKHGVLAAVLSHAPHPTPSQAMWALTNAIYANDTVALRMIVRASPATLSAPLDEKLPQVLQWAADDASLDTIRWLIEEGKIPVNTPVSQVGHTMLDIAQRAKRPEVIAYLRSKGAVNGYPPRTAP